MAHPKNANNFTATSTEWNYLTDTHGLLNHSYPFSSPHLRYYFKKVSDEFDCGVVFEEVREDDAILPIFEEKIIGKVEKID